MTLQAWKEVIQMIDEIRVVGRLDRNSSSLSWFIVSCNSRM